MRHVSQLGSVSFSTDLLKACTIWTILTTDVHDLIFLYNKLEN